jgi:peptidyl-prolyl cis-trans isomerase B (cyclophilin B)
MPPIGVATPPPVDVATVIGKHVTWHVVTTTGELAIELRPDIAPWNVATIVALTQRGFYNGIEFHRVVPDFVVQGGDPTMSGVGGPGFTTPAEPATSLDGPGFTTGGIGIADAGRDSGGSQWFVMHSRAPHLDGRYTYIGEIVHGQSSADSLLIGDKIVKATVEIK